MRIIYWRLQNLHALPMKIGTVWQCMYDVYFIPAILQRATGLTYWVWSISTTRPATFSSIGIVLSTPAVRKETVCCLREPRKSSTGRNHVLHRTLMSVKVSVHLLFYPKMLLVLLTLSKLTDWLNHSLPHAFTHSLTHSITHSCRYFDLK